MIWRTKPQSCQCHATRSLGGQATVCAVCRETTNSCGETFQSRPKQAESSCTYVARAEPLRGYSSAKFKLICAQALRLFNRKRPLSCPLYFQYSVMLPILARVSPVLISDIRLQQAHCAHSLNCCTTVLVFLGFIRLMMEGLCSKLAVLCQKR